MSLFSSKCLRVTILAVVIGIAGPAVTSDRQPAITVIGQVPVGEAPVGVRRGQVREQVMLVEARRPPISPAVRLGVFAVSPQLVSPERRPASATS